MISKNILNFNKIFNSKCILNYYKLNTRYLHKVCIIGSGPAGFYSAQQLIKGNCQVDIYEKLPVPFGLIRYGVAPDHPEVKNVINTFTTVLKSPSVQFFGNVDIGKDITFNQLKNYYDAILLSYGSSQDRRLEIPGEDKHVISGRQFVGWYNGLPENQNLKIELQNAERAIIFGQGNVALDIARILLSPIIFLEKTDITPYALDALKKSKIKEVIIFGRRGPLQVSFTIKELRELINLPGSTPKFDIKDFEGINDEFINKLPRPKKRLTELLYKTAQSPPTKDDSLDNDKYWKLRFFRSPISVDNKKIKLMINKLKVGGENIEETGEVEVLESDIIFRSIGYKGIRLFNELPFEEKTGVIPNKNGFIQQGVYCCGWLASGPKGVILSTMQNAYDVAKQILHDISSVPPKENKDIPLPSDKNVIKFKDYEKIAEYEKKNGIKVSNIEEMLKIAKNN